MVLHRCIGLVDIELIERLLVSCCYCLGYPTLHRHAWHVTWLYITLLFSIQIPLYSITTSTSHHAYARDLFTIPPKASYMVRPGASSQGFRCETTGYAMPSSSS